MATAAASETATDTAAVEISDTDTPTTTPTDTPTPTPNTPASDTPEPDPDTPDGDTVESDTPESDTSESDSPEPSAGVIELDAVGSQSIDGERVEITFQVNNTGGESRSVIVDPGAVLEGLAGDWIVVNRSDDGGAWRESDRVWLFQSLGSGESSQPSIAVEPPADAEGAYSGEAIAQSNSTSTSDTLSFTIQDRSLVEAVDMNDNGRIGDSEILQAIEWWRTDQTVADADLRISNQQILNLATLWQEGGSHR